MPLKKTTDENGALDKLKSIKLRGKVEAGGDDALSVIAEVDLTPQKVQVVTREERQRGRVSLGQAVVPESPEQQRANAERIARMRDFIESVLGTKPRWLNSARAFVFHATPNQLRDIAAFQLTRAIRPNRHLDR